MIESTPKPLKKYEKAERKRQNARHRIDSTKRHELQSLLKQEQSLIMNISSLHQRIVQLVESELD